jgi:hypothetical protein
MAGAGELESLASKFLDHLDQVPLNGSFEHNFRSMRGPALDVLWQSQP